MNPTATPPTPARRTRGRRCVVIDADWAIYTRLLAVYETKPGHRLAYDRGRLEIMSPSLRHDNGDRFLSVLVHALTEELNLPVMPGGGTTMRRRRRQRGIEGDEIFWITNAPAMAGVTDLDLRIHPPPDLAIEVDVSRSSLDRLGIYAALRVPEVWRLDGDALHFYALAGTRYDEVAASRAFPVVTPADLLGFVQAARGSGDINPIVRRFREWVRQRVAAPPPA